VYIPQDELDEYVEDLQAMGSEKYKAMIKASRASGTVSAEEVWKHL
jgi:predicted transcriptional regulator